MRIDVFEVPALIAARPLVVAVLLPMLFVGLVAYGVYELLRSRGVIAAGAGAGAGTGGTGVAASPAGPSPASPTAVTILDERFARGEIDAEEYVQRRTLLSPGSSPVDTAPPGPVETASPAPVDTAPPAGPDPATAVVADEATSEQPATTVEPGDSQSEGQHPA